MRILKKLKNLFIIDIDLKERTFGLDLMRTIAILIVVIGHSGLLLEKANTNFPWVPLPDGVELFFVLSGYLIGEIILKNFINTTTWGIKNIIQFWIRRWFRTLPNYYLILFLNILFAYFHINDNDIKSFNWKYFFFLQNLYQHFTEFFWESWSISVEEWFYFSFPLLLFLFHLFRKKETITSKKFSFFYTILFILILTNFFRFFIASKFTTDDFWLETKIKKVVIYRLDGIGLGLLGAYLKYFYKNTWFKYKNIKFILGIILNYVLLLDNSNPDSFSSKTIKLFFQSFACFLFLPKFDSIIAVPLWIKRVVTHISLISYSMYLINLSLVAQVILFNFAPENSQQAWFLFVGFWICILFFSTILYKYFEKPIMDIREKIIIT